ASWPRRRRANPSLRAAHVNALRLSLWLTAAAVPIPQAAAQTASSAGEWSAYGRDAGGTRYSPLAQITRANVARLRLAWVYRTGDYLRDRGRFEAVPLVVDGTLYVSTPVGRVIALDPARGTERWRYDARVSLEGDYGDFANRGVSTWLDPAARPDTQCRRPILSADPARNLVFIPTGSVSPDFYGGERRGDNRYANSVVALEASTGRLVWSFQVVHHDLWDYDVPAQPVLFTLRRAGRAIPAVAVA